MEQIIIGSIIAFLVTFYAIPVIMKVADLKKLYDVPDERKIHKQPIPSLGGFGIFVGFAVALLLMLDFTRLAAMQYYFAAFLIIFFLGIKDDIVILSAQKKFVGQLLVAAILMFKAKLLITDMHGFFGITVITQEALRYCLTLFTIIVIVNAFNLIDGVDGLAGSLGLVSSSVFAIFFLMNKDYTYAAIGFALAASILAFLIYNFHPAKIFMGDTGSLMIGLVNTILVIHFIESANTASTYKLLSTPALGFGILLLPLMDTLRVFGIRIFHGRSPFSPDRNHIHHILLDRGLNHRQVTLTLSAVSIALVVLSFVLQPIGTTYLILGLIGLFFLGILALYLTKPKPHLHVVKDEVKRNKVRLVSIYTEPAPAAVDEE